VLVYPGREGASDDLPPENVSLAGEVNADRVRMRDAPNTKGRILGQFDKGHEFSVTGRYSSGNEKYPWFGVISGDVSGWMYGQYLRLAED
jgi:hypothetical protein